jgi:hypothetical protein
MGTESQITPKKKKKKKKKKMLNLKEGVMIRSVATQAVFLIPIRPYPKNEVLQEMQWASDSCAEQYDSSRDMLQCVSFPRVFLFSSATVRGRCTSSAA